MRRLGRVLAILFLAVAILGFAKRDQIARLHAAMTLFDQDKIVGNFSHMDRMFASTQLLSPPHEPSPLPKAPHPLTPPAGLEDWVAQRNITALMVLHKGEVAFEDYYQGTGPEDLRVSWSMAKSFLATLLGFSLLDGSIASIEDPVTKYAPELKGSAYDGATIRNVLHMASGVEFNEDYLDFWSDINKMGRIIATSGSLDDFTAGLKTRSRPPGEAFHYVSMDTHVIGMVLRGATGRSIPDLMNERVITPLHLERDPYYLTDSTGTAFVLGGLNMTTRDYARFGQMILQDGHWQDRALVPETWIREMTADSAPRGDDAEHYGYQWWLPHDARPGEFYARGVYGQYIWFDRAAETVIVVNAADTGFAGEGVHDQNMAMMRALVRATQ
ncbi:MAG: serine hydrolase [Maritimibacter sp.]